MDTYHIALALAVLAQFALFLRWLYRTVRTGELMRAFVRDMATNHLPHIYQALRAICRTHGVELDEPPPIRWLDLNDRPR